MKCQKSKFDGPQTQPHCIFKLKIRAALCCFCFVNIEVFGLINTSFPHQAAPAARISATIFRIPLFLVMLASIANNSLAAPAGIPDKAWQPSFVTLETTMGELTIELYWKHAPNTCRNFAELARRGYYNNTIFHRIIQDFMIQGGDPTGTGRGGTSIYGASFEDEFHADLKHTGAGILSMANSGPNSNGSQFFITLAPTQWLDGKHTIFGRIHTGMQSVKRIGLVECDKNDRPVEQVRIIKGKVDKY